MLCYITTALVAKSLELGGEGASLFSSIKICLDSPRLVLMRFFDFVEGSPPRLRPKKIIVFLLLIALVTIAFL